MGSCELLLLLIKPQDFCIIDLLPLLIYLSVAFTLSDSDDIDAEELLQQLELEVQHRLSKTPRRTQVQKDRDDVVLDVTDSLEEDEGERKCKSCQS